MNILKTVLKIVVALAAIAGAIYVIATYGDKIVAWAKRILGCTECALVEEEAIVEEPEVAEEAVEEVPVEEPAAEEIAAEEEPHTADEADFEG